MRVLKGLLLALLAIAIAGILLLGVMVHRGFRASATPTAGEATIARRVRNFAIPRS